MNSCVLSVSRYLIPAFVTACWATGSLAQQGPPNGLSVNVLNTPTVNIGNTPLAVTGSVTTSGSVSLAPGSSVTVNTSTGPVLVKSVNDGIQTVQAKGTCTSPTIGCQTSTLYTVPANKRLVIEYVSLEACGVAGTAISWDVFVVPVGNATGDRIGHHLNSTPIAAGPVSGNIGCTPGGGAVTAVGQVVRLYSETGSDIFFIGDRTNGIGLGTTITLAFTFSGYLVDAP
jgi:hypothetical protein